MPVTEIRRLPKVPLLRACLVLWTMLAIGPLACGANDGAAEHGAESAAVNGERNDALAVAGGPAVPSPSGRYSLQVVRPDAEHPERLDVEILAGDGEVLFRSGERFDDRSVTMFLWDDDERAWVYSGDVGTFYWERGATPDLWQRHVYAESDVPAPPELREARPGQHPR